MKRTLIFGNGSLHKKFLREIHDGDLIIGVDRAAYWLLTEGITPDMAIGDFDSVTKKEFLQIKKLIKTIKKYSPEKDATDMELAINHAKGETYIFGGSGTRLDHTLATLSILSTQIFIDKTNRIRKITKGRTILKYGGYSYVSIIPITQSIQIKLNNFKYNLPKTTIHRGSTRTISNEFTGKKGIIELFVGVAWVIESND